MYIYFVLNHPAHFHLFKNSIKELSSKGHECKIFIRPKDMLRELLDSSGLSYEKVPDSSKNKKHHIIVSSVCGLLKKDIKLSKCILQRSPDLMIGTDWAITNVGRLFNIPSIVLNEDDTIATPENNVFYPLAKTLVLPDCCDKGLWENKRVSYSGYHELAYLHPNQFSFDKCIVLKNIGLDKPYIIIRLVSLTASHDKGKKGLGIELLKNIISLSKNKYKALVSFEDKIPKGFEKYKFNFNPNYMHHFLAGADLVIGDSQTMIAEAAVLGTPSIRFNDFVGKLGYLEELEKKYSLAFGFTTNKPKDFLEKTKELLSHREQRPLWKKKVKRLLADKIDVTAFMVWFIENYPQSLIMTKKNPDYQYNFR